MRIRDLVKDLEILTETGIEVRKTADGLAWEWRRASVDFTRGRFNTKTSAVEDAMKDR